MTGAFLRLLERYGQTVELRRRDGAVPVRAFLQPVLERREDWRQSLPTPLGQLRRDRFLYLGPAEVPLEGAAVVWGETVFEVLVTQPVYVGQHCSHRWAVLRPLGDHGGMIPPGGKGEA